MLFDQKLFVKFRFKTFLKNSKLSHNLKINLRPYFSLNYSFFLFFSLIINCWVGAKKMIAFDNYANDMEIILMK